MNWKNIYIFISSTFNDMHAERDFLIKRVFPELRLWCNERRLKLIDIDLRWGVSEKDATENKRVVDVCLKNVDKCRPFLLCFLGQRRGWIPGWNDINPDTLVQFPSLSDYLEKHSITELEVIHGLIHPLNEGQTNMRHAFFYCRKPDYLADIQDETVKKLFQRETDALSAQEDDFDFFKHALKDQYSVAEYDTKWNPQKTSPELKNVHGQDLSLGRLDSFSIDGIPLETYVLNQLKKAIQEEFPEHFISAPTKNKFKLEIMHQSTFLFNACDSYIPRPKEEAHIMNYITGDAKKPFVLMANAGTGKTSLLAHLIQSGQIPQKVSYRFVGTSSASSDMEYTLYKLMEELCLFQFLPVEDVTNEKSNIVLAFPTLLNKITRPCCIILDAVDQWNYMNASSLRWIPEVLPDNVKLIISIKSDCNPEIISRLKEKDFIFHELSAMQEREEKIALIQEYLSQFLKDIDDNQIEHILSLPGSDNPLYLKIVLNELRIHGSFDTLMDELNKSYGQNPKEAFSMILNRLEQEIFGENIPSAELVKYVLGTIGCALEGVILEEFAMICNVMIPECKTLSAKEIMDAVYVLVRHLSPYLVIDGNRVSFLYDSFKQAVNERYQYYYLQFQNILATLYARYCYKTGGAKYNVPTASLLTCYAHHAINCTKNRVDTILMDPWFLYALLTHTNARKVATCFKMVYKSYPDTEEYAEIARAIVRLSARLDIGPNTLFYELARHVGLQNSIVAKLYDTASKVMDLPFYYPVKEEKTSGLPAVRELRMINDSDNILSKPEPFIIGNHVLYVMGDRVILQNITTEEIEKRVHLRGFVFRSYAFRDYLYVHYFNSDESPNGAFEIFKVPSFQSVFYSKQKPKLPEGFSWRTVCYGCNGVQYQYAQLAAKAEIPELYVYNLNSGALQIHSVFPEDTPRVGTYFSHDIDFCNEYLVEQSSLYAKVRLWHVPSATLLLEEDNDFRFYITSDKDDMWYASLTREGHFTCYLYHKAEDGTISLESTMEMTDKTLLHMSEIGASDGKLFLFFESGAFWVFDHALQFIGSQKLQLNIPSYFVRHIYCHQLLYTYGTNIRIMNAPRILTYAKDVLFEKLTDSRLIERREEPYNIVQDGNSLVLLSNECRKLGLNTMFEYTPAKHGRFKYCMNTIRYGSRRYVIGSTRDKTHFAAHMVNLDTLSTGLHFSNPVPEGLGVLEFAFFSKGIVGVLFWEEETHMRPISKENSPEHEAKCTSYQILYFDAVDNFKPLGSWRPDVYEEFISPFIFTENDISYLVFLAANVDTEHSELRIYDILQKELVFSYQYNHIKQHMCLKNDVFEAKDHLMIRYSDLETHNYHFLEISPTKGIVDKHVFEMGHIAGHTNSEIYISQNFSHEIQVYSLEKKEILHTRSTHSKSNCFRIIRNGNDLLALFTGGICEVYDADTLEYKYRQVLLPEYNTAAHFDNTNLVYIGTQTRDFAIFAPGSTGMPFKRPK